MQNARLASIGQLAAGIAHEINTPAQYIGSNLVFLSDEVGRMLQHLQTGRKSGRNDATAPLPVSDDDLT